MLTMCRLWVWVCVLLLFSGWGEFTFFYVWRRLYAVIQKEACIPIFARKSQWFLQELFKEIRYHVPNFEYDVQINENMCLGLWLVPGSPWNVMPYACLCRENYLR